MTSSKAASSLAVPSGSRPAARPRLYALGVNAAAVVFHFDNDGFAGGVGPQGDSSFGRLARGQAFLRRFQAVAYRVADQVQQRVHYPFDDQLINFSFLTAQREHGFLAELPRQIADDELHPGEHFSNGNQAQRASRPREVAELTFDRLVGLLQGSELRRGQQSTHWFNAVVEACPADNQFAGHPRINSSSRVRSGTQGDIARHERCRRGGGNGRLDAGCLSSRRQLVEGYT